MLREHSPDLPGALTGPSPEADAAVSDRDGAATGPLAAIAHALPGRHQADAWARAAREHWAAGRLAEAAAFNHGCRAVDPGRTPLWQSRAAELLDAASLQSLAVQNAVRLAVAGITAADPGLRQLAEHNAAIHDREAGQ